MSSPPPKHSLSSPTSGNTPHPVLPTPSSSTSVSIRQNNKSTQLRQELEQQLVEKQKQLQESSSGIGKNVLARQVSQLQDRLREMDTSSSLSDELQPASVDRLRSLERDLTSYRSHPLSPGISSIRNKEKLLNQRTTAGLDPLPSPSTSTLLPPTHGHDSTSLLPLPPPPTGSTPTKRRSKIPNTDRRNTDIEFATEIGQGLLLEVRKMQALLQEKEEKLRTLENQKADLERAAEAMAKQMRQREENEEKLKEETWNLELAKQELTISVTELQQNLSKANVEQNKLAKQVNELRSEIEQLRDREEKLTNTIDNMKQRHEQDMSSIRRHAAAIQREKTDQTKQIEALTSELAIAKAQSRIGKHVSTESEPNARSGETTDGQSASTLAVKNESSPTSSPPSSPKQSPARNQAMEVETLKTSLAHAHRMVSNLRSNLHKEKTEKFEFKKLLAESQETIEQLQNDPRMWVDAGPTRGGSGSTSNLATREDGLAPGRRSHKASTSSKRRGGKKSNAGRSNRLKGSSQNATADDDSVYSYSSMSDQEDSEIDSFDESDVGFDSSKKKSVGFTPLSSELSQVQMQKLVMVDAEVNTDPISEFMLPVPMVSTEEPVARSLGDELGMAMSSQKSPEEEDSTPITTSMKNIAGGLVAGAATALGVETLMKPEGVEISTQTDVPEEPAIVPGIEMLVQTNPEPKPQVSEMSIQTDVCELEQVSMSTMSVEPVTPVEFELVSQESIAVEPEDPSIALEAASAASAATIAASRLASLEAAITTSTQSDPEDSSIALAATVTAIAASRSAAIEAAVTTSTQSDEIVPEPEDPSIALVAAAASAAATAAAIVASRSAALEAAVSTSTQCDEPVPEPEDPSIALAATAAAIAASRSAALEAAITTSTQSEPEDPSIALTAAEAAVIASRSAAFEAAITTSTQSEPEDPSIVAASTAAAIAASRSAALDAAIDTATQSDEPEPEDPSIALEAAAVAAAATAAAITASRSTALEAAIDSATQSEGPSVIDQETQIDQIQSVDTSVQSVPVATVDAFIQSEAVETKNSDAQYEVEAKDVSVQYEDSTTDAHGIAVTVSTQSESVDHETQYDISGIDHSTQSELAETTECGVQNDELFTADAYAQHDLVQTKDIGVQAATTEETKGAATIIPIPFVSSRTFSDSEDEFFDATSDSKPNSRRTLNSIGSISAAAALNNVKPESRGVGDKIKNAAVPVGSVAQSERSVKSANKDDESKGHDAIIATTAGTAAALATAAVMNNNKPVSGNDHVAALDRSIHSDVNNYVVKVDASNSDLTSPINEDDVSSTQIGANSKKSDSDDKKNFQELSNAAPAEKMYSKSETDALIATAVALALAKATASNNKISTNDDKDDLLDDDTKRHTCDMSFNNKDTDSAVVSPSSALSGVARTEDDDEHDDGKDYGNVVVHLPRKEDTITSLPYDKIAQQQRHRDRDISPKTDAVATYENVKPQEKEAVKQRPELTVGPSIVYAQEPEEAKEPEITEADIPQRPANPPPTALLSRAGLSPTFTDNRSMSPSSLRSKGKAPFDYSDLESQSAPSNEDLQRTAALQQQHLDAKRGSVSASSISTCNTNEQLHSINSSQYDAVTRSTVATDPTMINLITQTMIGDWLWKYTRKAVGGGLSENRHQRYFWIHPYTRTLYWSTSAPGVDGNEAKAKSALIENITSVPDYSNAGDGTPNVSLLIQTSHRQLKLTAPNMEKHELWFEAISHLLARNRSGNGLTLLNDTRKADNPNNRSLSSGTTGSLLNRPSFRRLHDIFQQPSAAPSMATSTNNDHIELDDDDDEALEDVRMCCNGKHHVSKLEKDHTHRHQYRKRKSRNGAITTIG